ncbi:MAG: hypothetical protein WBL47_02250 [Bacilli bacterium]
MGHRFLIFSAVVFVLLCGAAFSAYYYDSIAKAYNNAEYDKKNAKDISGFSLGATPKK